MMVTTKRGKAKPKATPVGRPVKHPLAGPTGYPVEHVVIIFKENHTFDNYFGAFPGAAGVTLPRAPDPQVYDPLHDHSAWLAAEAGTGGLRLQYNKADIPAYWAYAQNYTLCDNYFTDVASQSEPNHLHVIAADSPIIDNSSRGRLYQPFPPYDIPSLPAALEAAGRTWRNYANANSSYFDHIASTRTSPWNVTAATFDKDVASGFLPDVSWLFPPAGMSEHPGDFNHTGKPIVATGMQWTVDRVHALASSPLWAKTAVFLTWDDWGGWYDHVNPPLASRWPGGGHKGYTNSQFRYGPRVPCLVLGPYARRGIDHAFCSHTSIVKFCLRLFKLTAWKAPALQPGDKSGDMWSCFDFAASPRLGVPPTKPT
jgi:phospholipase C